VGGEEVDEGGVVDALDRAAAQVLGRDDLAQPHLDHPVADHQGPPRRLEAGEQPTVDQLGLAVLERVVVRVDGEHRPAVT
jgi:hypothetical protein